MLENKHIKALKEVLDEISSALEDPKGLTNHQRRLALMIPLGVAELIEIYLHKFDVIKPGGRIKHDWLKRNSAIEYIERQCIKNIDDIKNLAIILEIAKEIELERNDIAYGAPMDDETILKENINKFFKIKDNIEEEIGDIFAKENK